MERSAVYAIRDFKRINPGNEHESALDQLDYEILEGIKSDFPNAVYACIMVRISDPMDSAEAEQIVRHNPHFTGQATAFRYDKGSDKGQPPSSTRPLP